MIDKQQQRHNSSVKVSALHSI